MRASRGFLRLVLAILVTLAWAGSASAQDAPTPAEGTAQGTSEARDEEARSLFQAGRTAFGDGRYADARDYFRRAYELSGRAELLYNVGTAEDRLRNDEAALEAFEAFLAAQPEAANRTEIEGRIAVLREAIAARTPVPTDPTPTPSSSGPTLLWTWVAGAAALATGATAIGLWVAANDQYATLENGCLALTGACTRDEVGATGVETYVTLTNVFLVSSLVLVGATGVALALELTSGPSDSDAAPRVALGIGLGSLTLEGTF